MRRLFPLRAVIPADYWELGAVVGLVLALTCSPALADWPNTNATKWVQFPDPRNTGYDVLVGQVAGAPPLIVADDFLCRQTGPITDIHMWASWLGDTPGTANVVITLGIWSDVAAITNGTTVIPSHPGKLLWSEAFGPGQYVFRASQTADEQFWNPDPSPQGTILGSDHLIWLYNFYPTKPFTQQGTATAPVVYWLSVTAGANTAMFGWKTSTNHWNDDAVFGHLDAASGQAVGDWKELRDPKATTSRSLDMAFALTTRPESPPPSTTNKWVQFPNQFKGLDINVIRPSIVADDFPCTAAGMITNIQIWASWQDDATPNRAQPIVLGIWSDISGGTADRFSRPGQLLWSETFPAGSYAFSYYTNGDEVFYDPATGAMNSETKIYLYNFVPTRPFCQKGSTDKPVVYWLSVSAPQTTSAFRLGWKTSTNHWNDDAVFGFIKAAGTAIPDWQELIDPRSGVSLDMAFVIKSGPPGPDCDPVIKPKWVQWPDPSTNGYDVRASAPRVVGDDFLCRVPGRVNGIRVWGSWLNDKVDSSAMFQLSLWTDIAAQSGTPTNYSRPGTLLCSTTFYPPQTVGTSVPRYRSMLYAEGLTETFLDPDITGTAGFIGTDTQIWQYDFYPRSTCWRQTGESVRPRVYWLTLTALPGATEQTLFGWKTSTNHWNDDAVYGHLNANNMPLGDWKELRDPRSGKSLDLSFALRNFPIVGINKDLKNLTQYKVDGVQIVVAGIHEITFHYDDVPAWPSFQASYSGGNTILTWAGKTVSPGAITHIGFEMGGSSLTIVKMAWLLAGTAVGTPIQVNHHTWGNGTALTLNNDFLGAAVTPLGGRIEFYAEPVPLELMNPDSQREPLVSASLDVQAASLLPGGSMRIPLPTPPKNAQYVMFLLNLADSSGALATIDFLQLPLDTALRPTVQSALAMPGMLSLSWTSLPGRTYRIQSSPSLDGGQLWQDVSEDMLGDGEDMMAELPIGSGQNFFRLVLLPE